MTEVDGWELGARVVADADAGMRRVPSVPCAAARRCACAASRPTTSGSAARSAGTRRCPPSGCCAIPDALSTRAAALTEPTAIAIHTVAARRCDARRPGARDRWRPRRAAHHRRAARAGRRRTSPCRSRRRRGASAPLAVGAATVVAPDELPRAPMAANRRRSVHDRVRVLGQRHGRPKRRSTSSTTPARSCSSAPGTSGRASTTIG